MNNKALDIRLKKLEAQKKDDVIITVIHPYSVDGWHKTKVVTKHGIREGGIHRSEIIKRNEQPY